MIYNVREKSIALIKFLRVLAIPFLSVIFMTCKKHHTYCTIELTHIYDTNPPIYWADGYLHPTDTNREREVTFRFAVNNRFNQSIALNPNYIVAVYGYQTIKPDCHESNIITVGPKEKAFIEIPINKHQFDEIGLNADTISALDLSNMLSFQLNTPQDEKNLQKVIFKKDTIIYVVLNAREYGDH